MSATSSPMAQGGADPRAALDALVDLHRLSVDNVSGFEKMVEKAEPSFRPVVERFHALHASHVQRLAQMIRAQGGVPDDDGSLMGTMNRAVIAVRAAVDQIDADTMKQVRMGEENVQKAFDTAIGVTAGGADREALVQMRGELDHLIAESPANERPA